MQEALIELRAAPLWAQIALACFASAALYMLVAPSVDSRRYARRFKTLSTAFGREGAPLSDQSFTAMVGERQFEVKHVYRTSTTSVGTTRGPYGHLLVSSTMLAARRWELHGVDIVRGGVRLRKALGHRLLTTGDAEFDAKYAVREDGIPIRERWLDQATRAAIANFYELPSATGTIWIQEGRLSHLISSPWKGVDGASLQALLTRQAALASALERTAGR